MIIFFFSLVALIVVVFTGNADCDQMNVVKTIDGCNCSEGFFSINYHCIPLTHYFLSSSYYQVPIMIRPSNTNNICQRNEIYDKNLQMCRCVQGFIKNTQGLCQLKSNKTQTITCHINEIYSEKTKTCQCIPGYQKDNNNVCKQIPQLICKQNEFLYKGKCLKCPENAHFDYQNQICKCNVPYFLKNQKCVFQQLQEKLSIEGRVAINQVYIYVTLKTAQLYKFSSYDQMKSFIKIKFETKSTIPDNAYCLQQAINLNKFECLIQYNNGVPMQKFKIIFSFVYQKEEGKTDIVVDPSSVIAGIKQLR